MTLIETQTTPRETENTAAICRLVIMQSRQGSQRGRVFLLNEGPWHLGRNTEPDCLPIDDAEVSRKHATLSRSEDGSWVIDDLRSRNGTFVNGRAVERAPLGDQDVVRIGGHVILFQALNTDACRLLLDPPPTSAELVGESHRMLAVRESIRRAAPGRGPVLVLGETGTGKERVAEAIHKESRRTGPFLSVNCGALPHALIESELFGHVAGAFTGAANRKGLFASANAGTLLLDEIGDMDPSLQKALLRALATGEVRPVGSDAPSKIDTRIVAATNVDLEKAVREGRFRADLYARLVAHHIVLPELRRRREDVLPLLRHCLGDTHASAEFSTDAAEALLAHAWPYNVREVEQVATGIAARLDSRRRIELSDLPDRIREPLAGRVEQKSSPSVLPSALLAINRDAPPSREELVQLLELHKGNMSHVAAFLRKGRRQVYRWAEQYAIDPASYRQTDD